MYLFSQALFVIDAIIFFLKTSININKEQSRSYASWLENRFASQGSLSQAPRKPHSASMLSQGLANPKPGHLISGRRFVFALREPAPSQISFCLNRIYQYQYLLILMLMLLVSQDFQRPEDLSLSIFINIVKSLLILRFSLFRRGKAVLFLCSLMRNDKWPSQADRIIRLQPPFLRSPRSARIAVRVLFVPEDWFQQTLCFPDGGVARVFARRSSSFAPDRHETVLSTLVSAGGCIWSWINFPAFRRADKRLCPPPACCLSLAINRYQYF